MEPSKQSDQRAELAGYRFDRFELLLRPLTLCDDGEPQTLPAQALKLLSLLVRNHQRLVTHDEIRDALWPDRTVDFSASIHVHIRRLRSALGDDASAPRFIKTIPRQGYQFMTAPSAVMDVSKVSPKRFTRVASLAAAMLALVLAFWIFIERPSQDDAPIVSAAAMDAYKRGQFLLDKRDDAATARSVSFFEAALESEPEFAQAHAAKARAHARLYEWDAARRSARRSLSIDPELSEAHNVLGSVALFHDWLWEDARSHFAAALEVSPADTETHQGFATYYAIQGDFAHTIEHMNIAMANDPGSTLIRVDNGWYHFMAGDYEGALSLCRQALDLAPESPPHRHCVIRAAYYADDVQAARAAIAEYMAAADADGGAVQRVLNAPVENMLASFDAWRLTRLEAKYPESAYAGRAFAAAGARDADRAFDYARKAIAARDPMIVFLSVDRSFAELGEDAQLQSLLQEFRFKKKSPIESAVGL